MTDTCGNEFSCDYSASTILLWMASQEPLVTADTFETRFGKAFRRGTGTTADYRLDVAYDDNPYEASSSLFHELCCCCRFWL
jgi:hypothetical protein